MGCGAITSTGAVTCSGDLNAGGEVTAFYNTSDAKYKEDVAPMQPMLATLNSLRPVEFTWNDECPYLPKINVRDTGLIAQELQPVMPQLVDRSVRGHLVIRYEKFVPYLLKGMQELTMQNALLSERLAVLEARFAA